MEQTESPRIAFGEQSASRQNKSHNSDGVSLTSSLRRELGVGQPNSYAGQQLEKPIPLQLRDRGGLKHPFLPANHESPRDDSENPSVHTSPDAAPRHYSQWSTPLGRSSTAQTSLAQPSPNVSARPNRHRQRSGLAGSFHFPARDTLADPSLAHSTTRTISILADEDAEYSSGSLYESDRSVSEEGSLNLLDNPLRSSASAVEQTQASSSVTGGKSIRASLYSEPGPTEVGSEGSVIDPAHQLNARSDPSSSSYVSNRGNVPNSRPSSSRQDTARPSPVFSLFPSTMLTPRPSLLAVPGEEMQGGEPFALRAKRLSDPTLGAGSRISTPPPIPPKSTRRRHSAEHVRLRYLQILAPAVEPQFAESTDTSVRRTRVAKATRLSTVPSLVEELSEMSVDSHGGTLERSPSRGKKGPARQGTGDRHNADDHQAPGLARTTGNRWVLRAPNRSLELLPAGFAHSFGVPHTAVVRNPGAGHLVRDSIVSAQASKSLQGSILVRSDSGDRSRPAEGKKNVRPAADEIFERPRAVRRPMNSVRGPYLPLYQSPRLVPSKRLMTRVLWSAPSPELENSGALKLVSKVNFCMAAFAIGFVFPLSRLANAVHPAAMFHLLNVLMQVGSSHLLCRYRPYPSIRPRAKRSTSKALVTS